MRTIEQQRAANALARVNELQKRGDEFKARYRAYVDSLGPTIIMNGLGQALATELAAAGPPGTNDKEPKGDGEDAHRKAAHKELYLSLQRWLCRTDGGVYSPGDLLEAITTKGEAHYRHAQAEALAWLEWHKKCCRAAFPKGDRD